jgi:hypothetical protein
MIIVLPFAIRWAPVPILAQGTVRLFTIWQGDIITRQMSAFPKAKLTPDGGIGWL